MCLNSLALKHTCHWLNSEIGWDIRSDIFFVAFSFFYIFFFGFRITFSAYSEKKKKEKEKNPKSFLLPCTEDENAVLKRI